MSGFDSRPRLFCSRRRLATSPPRGDHRCEQRSAKPVEKSSENDQRMEINVNRVPENDREREHTPAHQGESHAAAHPSSERRTLITRDDREKQRDPHGGENVDRAGKSVTSPALEPPGLWSQLLKSMKNRAHPQPARENRQNSRDETGNERLRKMQAVHGCNRNRNCRTSTTVKTAAACISGRSFQMKRSMH